MNICVIHSFWSSSVASFLVLGGGGKTPICTDKNNIIYVPILRERAKRASASETYFQDSKYICIQCHIQSMQFPLITYRMALYTRHYTDKTLKLREIYEYASERSEQA